jgi:hypothetical protein
MALASHPLILTMSVLSWLLSLCLFPRLWGGNDPLAIKLGLSSLLFVPVAGPLLYFWIQSFPESNHPDLRDQYIGGDVHNRWRDRLEAKGRLKPLEKIFARKRRK